MTASSLLCLAVLVAALLVGCSDKVSSRDEDSTSAANTRLSTGTPTTGAARQTGTPSPTAAPSPQEEVLAAYGRYWDAYSMALFELNADLVQTVAANEERDRIRQEIDRLRAQGVALKVNVRRSPLVVEVNENSAIVFDEMVNNSFYVDARTKDPPQASGSGEIIQDTYFLQWVDGTWKVVRSTRQR
jgi:hypothetical protein